MKKGFTLIELLIVVSVIGILSAVLLSIINPTRQRNRASEVVNAEAVRKVASAVEAFTSANGRYPTDTECNSFTPTGEVGDDKCGGYLSSWPRDQQTGVAEIGYVNVDPLNYYIYVQSKLDTSPPKFICYKSNTGKVYKKCNSTCPADDPTTSGIDESTFCDTDCSTGCVEGVL